MTTFLAMNPQHYPQSEPYLPVPPLASLRIQPTSPRVPLSVTPTAGAQRRIAIAVDLSDESAYAVRWSVQNYLRPGDAVILLHIHPTSVLYHCIYPVVVVRYPNEEEAKKKKITGEDAELQPVLEEELEYYDAEEEHRDT